MKQSHVNTALALAALAISACAALYVYALTQLAFFATP